MVKKSLRAGCYVMAMTILFQSPVAWSQSPPPAPRNHTGTTPPPSDALNSCYVYLTRFLGIPRGSDSGNGTILAGRSEQGGGIAATGGTRSGPLGVYIQAFGRWYFRQLHFPTTPVDPAVVLPPTQPRSIEFNVGLRRDVGRRAFHITLEPARDPQGLRRSAAAARPYEISSLEVLNTGDLVTGNAREPLGNFNWGAQDETTQVNDEAVQKVLIEALLERVQAASSEAIRSPARARQLVGLPADAPYCISPQVNNRSLPLVEACGPILQSTDVDLINFSSYLRPFIARLIANLPACPPGAPAQQPSRPSAPVSRDIDAGTGGDAGAGVGADGGVNP